MFFSDRGGRLSASRNACSWRSSSNPRRGRRASSSPRTGLAQSHSRHSAADFDTERRRSTATIRDSFGLSSETDVSLTPTYATASTATAHGPLAGRAWLRYWPGVITGAHAVIYSRNAEADRSFFRDVLRFDSVDAGGGWLIFTLPPAELAMHPHQTGGRHELYLMCSDVHATVKELRDQGVEIVRDVTDEGFGLACAIGLPGGGELGLYEPRHPSPLIADA